MLKSAQTENAFSKIGSQKQLDEAVILKNRNIEQDLHTLKLHNAKKVEISSRLQKQPFQAQRVETFVRPHSQLMETPNMKRESLNFMSKRTDRETIPLKQSMQDQSPGQLLSSPGKARVSTNRTMSD